MTRDEVLAMKPGRELDALVAEKVMGWKVAQVFDLKDTDGTNIANGITPYNIGKRVPHYSTDISAAWEVAEQLQKQGYAVCIELLPYEKTSVGVYEADPAEQIAYAKAQTPAEAICKAALLAVMEGEKDD